MVFAGGAPSFDWQRTTETGEGVAQLREPLLFGGSWSYTLMVQEDFDAEKTGSYRRDTHRSAALMILVVSVRSRSHDSCCHQTFFRT